MFEINDIVKSSGMFLVAKNQYYKFIYCSENFAEAMGLDSPQQIVNKTDEDFFEEQAINLYRKGDKYVLDGGSLINVIEEQKRCSKIFKNMVTKTPLKNQYNDITGIVIAFLTGENFPHKTHNLIDYNSENKRYEFYIENQLHYFTESEYEIFKYLLLGYTAKQIAKKIERSYRTVEGHVIKIKEKLQCSSKYHIPEAAQRLGITSYHL